VRSGEQASVYEGILGDVSAAHKFPELLYAFRPPNPPELAVFEVPRGNDFVALEEKEFGGARDGLGFFMLFEIGQLDVVQH
jgi:hypothetical protein